MDVHGTIAVSANGDEWTITGRPLMPADESGVDRVYAIGPEGPPSRIRLVRRASDGSCADLGAGDFASPSRHPFFPTALAESIEMARRAVSAIPACRNVDIGVYASRTSEGDVLTSSTCFWDLRGAMIQDVDVDPIPYARTIDRIGSAVAEHLGLKAYDDGSGYPGELNIDLRPAKLFMTYTDDDGGSLVVASETLDDGTWSHVLRIEAIEEIGPIEHLRAVRDGHVDRAADAIERNPCFEDSKVDRSRLKVLGVEEKEETEVPQTFFHVDPASLAFLP